MDEDHLLTAARYVELNPVRTGLVQAPSRYRWSSAVAHLRGRDDVLVQVAPLLQMAPNWRRLLTSAISEEELKALRAHESTGRPLGDENFLALLEQNLGRILRRQKPGPKDVQRDEYYPGKKDHHKRVTTERPHPTGGSCPREGHGKGKLIRILFSVDFGGFRG